MSYVNPLNTTAGDLCKSALKEAGAIGVGQTPLAEDILDAQARMQWMLQQWERKRWLVYHLVTLNITSTGAQSYTVGPGGDIETGVSNPFNTQFNSQFGGGAPGIAGVTTARPAKLESAFLRQLTQSQPNQIDYPLQLLQSMEDYNRIALKQLMTFPGYVFYDSAWPLGVLYPWPVPQPDIYAIYITILEQLPAAFATLSTVINLPFEYFNAIVLNLALRLRPKYGLLSMQGDNLPALAKESLGVLRGANTQIARLVMPGDLMRPQLYNIFSDRMY